MTADTAAGLTERVSAETLANLERYGWSADDPRLELLSRDLGLDEVVQRVHALGKWLQSAVADRDGVYLTPVLLDHLGQLGDFASLLSHLDILRAETRAGRFRLQDPVQRDLEFRRFIVQHGKSFGAAAPNDEVYELFLGLESLEPVEDVPLTVTSALRDELRRAAFEAQGFLAFLDDFRANTSRPIVVVGNDKAQLAGGGYGRQWVVEPLEDYLGGGVRVFYLRVPSHGTMRLTVPSPFPKDLVRRLGDSMPHLVIVDGASPPAAEGIVRFSKAARGYANWFAAFNDVRAEGKISSPAEDTPLHADHLSELRRWHEYTEAQEQLEGLVEPGPAYRVVLWAPESTEKALLGEIEVKWPSGALTGDSPVVVLANPIVYRGVQGSRGLPDFMATTKPYYLDSADRYLREVLTRNQEGKLSVWGASDSNSAGPVGGLNPGLSVFGFGPHGLERRIQGPTMERYFRTLQLRIRRELATMLEQDSRS